MEDNFKMKSKQQNRVVAGLILVLAGAALLLRNVGFVMIPGWLFSWPMILIAIGFFSGLRHNFRNKGALFMLGIGGFFLLAKLLPALHLGVFFWPVIIIASGVYFMLRPEKTNWRGFNRDDCRQRFETVEEVKA